MLRIPTQSVTLKVLVLLVLTVVLCIPLGQIQGLIEDRSGHQLEAARSLAQSHAGTQLVVGPLLVVPIRERWTEDTFEGGRKTVTPRTKDRYHYVFPEKLDIAGEMVPEERYRGLFKVLFYAFDGRWKGHFPAFDPATLRPTEANATVEALTPFLAISLRDVRGIQGAPVLTAGGDTLKLLPRVPSDLLSGVHAPLAGSPLQLWQQKQAIPFDLKMTVIGQQQLAIAPMADETTASVRSPWPHPSFGGQFLAVKREVTPQGFDAKWSVSSLVSNARGQLLRGAPSPSNPVDAFEVSLVEPVNVYSMSLRAVKYGALFVALTLMATFMFELFRKLRLHPVQYGLVGFSIALFFLVLVALSEKVAFMWAYAAAASASVVLLAVYFSAVLGSVWRGLSLGAYVAALYGALYTLLASEDNALLMGALLLFGLTAILMLATRKVNWYAVSVTEPAGAG